MLTIETKIDFILPKDSAKMLQKVRIVLEGAIRENFRQGGRPTWEKKYDGSPSYLTKTGQLKASITSGSDDKSAWVKAGGTGYGRAIQFGASIPLQPNAPQSRLPGNEGSTRGELGRRSSGSRAMFWYLWYATKDPKWKAMAMTRKTSLRIPSRPFMTLTENDIAQIREAVKQNLFTVERNFWVANG